MRGSCRLLVIPAKAGIHVIHLGESPSSIIEKRKLHDTRRHHPRRGYQMAARTNKRGEVLMKKQKKIIIIAGPNGAGKTTFAQEFLPNEAGCPNFVNADLIAAGLSPFIPEVAAIKAGRLMLEQIHEYSRRGNSFAFETTLSGNLSGKMYAQPVPKWRADGYVVKLFFLSLPSVDLAISRVRFRVSQGGHDVPIPVIRRRFAAGLRNFHAIYKHLVDEWALFDNSGKSPQLIEEGVNA